MIVAVSVLEPSEIRDRWFSFRRLSELTYLSKLNESLALRNVRIPMPPPSSPSARSPKRRKTLS